MNSSIENIVFTFFMNHVDLRRPVLLALSGGPDSMTLFRLLLKYQEHAKLQFAVAHINHNWRLESQDEASLLKNLCKNCKLNFHVKHLDPRLLTGNLEEACRNERYRFFKEMSRKHGYQAVLLGHHADDQAETVLKRMFEGASLSKLKAMKAVSQKDGLNLWRPLLTVPKAHIMKWLEENNILFLNDTTNLNPRFLRGKLRTAILPALNESFGKNISNNLLEMANESGELSTFLENHLSTYLEGIEQGPMGSYLDLTLACPQTPFEIKNLLRLWLKKEGLQPSREVIDTACDLILANKANRHFKIGDKLFYIDRRRLFLMSKTFDESSEHVLLKEGVSHFGPWKVSVKVENNSDHSQNIGWKA